VFKNSLPTLKIHSLR